MPRPTSKATESNPWAALALHVTQSGTREPKGEGWVRSDDIAELMQCSHSTSKQVIKRLLSEGKAERFRGAAVTESGLVRSRVWYRLK